MRRQTFLTPLLLLVLAACGGGPGSTTPGTTVPSAAPVATGTAGGVESEAPSAGATDAGMSHSMGDDPTAPASQGASDAAGTVTVTGVDYLYEGMPSTVPTGTELAFRNDGEVEPHEMVVLRKNDDVEETFEELLELPQEEALAKAEVVGGVDALPGQVAEDTVAVEEPGEYALICFIPVGTMVTDVEPQESMGHESHVVGSLSPNESDRVGEPSGPPHYTQGMLQTFSVTE